MPTNITVMSSTGGPHQALLCGSTLTRFYEVMIQKEDHLLTYTRIQHQTPNSEFTLRECVALHNKRTDPYGRILKVMPRSSTIYEYPVMMDKSAIISTWVEPWLRNESNTVRKLNPRNDHDDGFHIDYHVQMVRLAINPANYAVINEELFTDGRKCHLGERFCKVHKGYLIQDEIINFQLKIGFAFTTAYMDHACYLTDKTIFCPLSRRSIYPYNQKPEGQSVLVKIIPGAFEDDLNHNLNFEITSNFTKLKLLINTASKALLQVIQLGTKGSQE